MIENIAYCRETFASIYLSPSGDFRVKMYSPLSQKQGSQDNLWFFENKDTYFTGNIYCSVSFSLFKIHHTNMTCYFVIAIAVSLDAMERVTLLGV